MSTENKMHGNVVIAAVNNIDHLDLAIQSACNTIFLLTGNLFNLENSIKKARKGGKKIYIHVDFMEGFSQDATFLEYLSEVLKPDGVITTRSNIARKAKSMKLFVIQRFFIFDSMSLESGINTALSVKPDAIEVLPGIMPKIIKKVREETKQPVIGSGLIMDKDDIDKALGAGAIGITTSNIELWGLK